MSSLFKIKTVIAAMIASAMAFVVPTVANAAVAALPATAVAGLLGDDTADAETGLFAIQIVAETGIVIVVGIAVIFAGAMLVRRLIHGGSRA